MSIIPVIGRELRAQARQPLTFWLRLVGAGAIGLAFWMAYSSLRLPDVVRNFQPTAAAQQMEFQNFGVALFGKMNMTIFVAVWLFTPLASADSISRERREGTLPLLRLTRLRPWEIVLGKTFVQMLRSSTLFFTMVPWLLIPFLFGGVSLQDFEIALMLDLTALFLAQSAGLLASTFSRDWLKAVIWAEALALALLLGMMSLYESVLEKAFTKTALIAPARQTYSSQRQPPTGLWGQFYLGQGGFLHKRTILFGLLTNGTMEYQFQQRWFTGRNFQFEFRSTWQELWGALNAQGRAAWLQGAAMLLAGSIAAFVICVLLAAAYVERSWRETVRSAAWERWRQKYFTPKYGVRTLRARLSRSLTRNPIGWLHQYSPSARLTKWSWCLFLITIEMFLATNFQDLYTAQAGIGFVLLLGVLFSSTGSFRHELESGAFELLLVTPLREKQILFGRVRGIWQQFVPAFIIYGAGALFLGMGWVGSSIGRTATDSTLSFGILFLSAPFIGLYFSLLRWNFLAAWACASLIALVLPMVLPLLLRGVAEVPSTAVWIIQLAVTALFAWRIRKRLQNRVALSQFARAAAA